MSPRSSELSGVIRGGNGEDGGEGVRDESHDAVCDMIGKILLLSV